MVEVTRINNNSYFFIEPKTKKKVEIQINSKVSDAEFRFNLAKKTAEVFITKSQTKERNEKFKLAGKTWSIEKASKVGLPLKIGSHLTTFIHKQGDDGVIRIDVREMTERPKYTGISEAAIAAQENSHFITQMQKANFKRQKYEARELTTFGVVTPEEYDQHVRGKLFLDESHILPMGEVRFSDPFTKLATLAFQRYEPQFTAKDDFKPQDCDYCVIKEGTELKLVHKDNTSLITPKKSRETIDFYKEHLIQEYGQEKVDYIQFLYGFSLDQAEVLTPEHIYRFNIGVTNIEVQDIDSLLAKMISFKKMENVDEEALSLPLERLTEIFPFTGNEVRGIYSAIQKEGGGRLTVADFIDWLDKLAPLPANSNELDSDQLHELMKVFKLKPDELQDALTGRRIHTHIISGYTTADLGVYKPWVDQQELSQVLHKLETAKDPISYHELLAYVVSKNHLAREHPTEGYRVGALIPAPSDSQGRSRYYKVTSCVSNGHGIFSYTLESVNKDPTLPRIKESVYKDSTLPPIKLLRSTASAVYSLQSQASVLNDINSLNSPGYEGLGLGDEYEMPFFRERTIPIWTGYLTLVEAELAKDKPELNAIFEDLKEANSEILFQFERQHERRTLGEVLKTNDGALNDLLLSDASFWGPVKTDVDSQFPALYAELATKHAHKKATSASSETKRQEVLDAKRLLDEINKMPLENQPSRIQIGVKKLKTDLEEHVLSQAIVHRRTVQKKIFDRKIYGKLTALKKDAEILLQQEDYQMAEKKMRKWAKKLAAYSESQGEKIENKKAEDFVLTGHSLGGALVQSHLVHTLVNPGRMPLPNQTVYAYEFDAPGANDEDNDKAVKMLLQHSKMFERLGVNIHYVRRQEYGDFVPAGGQTHLFSVHTSEQEQALRQCKSLKLNQAVWRRLPTAKDPRISEAETAHATQFGDGKRLRTFSEEGQESQEADHIETYFTPFLQGLFDRQGEIGATTHERNKNKKQYKEIYANLWGLSGFKDLWGPVSAEKVRRSSNPATLILKKTIMERGGLDRSLSFQDDKGVFAVTEEGPISRMQGIKALKGIELDEGQQEFMRELKKAQSAGLISFMRIREFMENPKILHYYEQVKKLKKEKEEDPTLKKAPEHILARKSAKAKLAFAVGVEPKSPDEGAHLTYFLRSLTGKKVGVFKQATYKDQGIKTLFRWAGGQIGIGQSLVLNRGKYAEIATEKASYLIKEKLGLHDFEMAPVRITSFNDFSGNKTDKGAFLVFCKDVKLARDVLTDIEKDTFSKEEKIKFQSAVLYDFLLGNLDRHTENWMVGVTEEGEISRILFIDNANVLPKEEPSILNLNAVKSRFIWKKLKIAGFPIEPEVREMYSRLLKDPDAFVEELFHEIQNDSEIKKLFKFEKETQGKQLKTELDYFSKESKETMKKRARHLAQELKKQQVSPRLVVDHFK